MSTYLIVYDLTENAPSEAYKKLTDALHRMNAAPLQKSAWLLSPPFSDKYPIPEILSNTLQLWIEAKDRLIVTPVNPGVDFIHINDMP